jgi:hypothetical protein
MRSGRVGGFLRVKRPLPIFNEGLARPDKSPSYGSEQLDGVRSMRNLFSNTTHWKKVSVGCHTPDVFSHRKMLV